MTATNILHSHKSTHKANEFILLCSVSTEINVGSMTNWSEWLQNWRKISRFTKLNWKREIVSYGSVSVAWKWNSFVSLCFENMVQHLFASLSFWVLHEVVLVHHLWWDGWWIMN